MTTPMTARMTTPTTRVIRVLALLAVGILVLAACGSDDGDDTATAGDTTPGAEDTADGGDTTDDDTTDDGAGDGDTTDGEAGDGDTAGDVAVRTAETDLGVVLVDADGLTLYAFTQDETGASNCTGGCAENWPPVTVDGEVSVGDDLDPAAFSTIERPDGSRQVAIGGTALYGYQDDAAPGDVNGQGVGDAWFVVSPDGDLIRDSGDSAAGTPEDGGGERSY